MAGPLEAPWAECIAHHSGQHELLEWLQQTRHWTPLHHLEQLTTQRLQHLLRAGADLHFKPAPEVPSPKQRAQQLDPTPVTQMLLQAAEPWSPSNHALFPDSTRLRAWDLLRLGVLLSRSPQFAGEAGSFEDVWVSYVMPHALSR